MLKKLKNWLKTLSSVYRVKQIKYGPNSQVQVISNNSRGIQVGGGVYTDGKFIRGSQNDGS